MRSTFLLLALLVLLVFTNSCKKCNNENPTARVLNNGTAEVDVRITGADGNIIVISDLAKGLISSEKSYVTGNATVNYKIESIEKTETVSMKECYSYDISINSDNKMVVFSQEKD